MVRFVFHKAAGWRVVGSRGEVRERLGSLPCGPCVWALGHGHTHRQPLGSSASLSGRIWKPEKKKTWLRLRQGLSKSLASAGCQSVKKAGVAFGRYGLIPAGE